MFTFLICIILNRYFFSYKSLSIYVALSKQSRLYASYHIDDKRFVFLFFGSMHSFTLWPMIAEVQEIFTSYIIIIKKPKKQNHTFFLNMCSRGGYISLKCLTFFVIKYDLMSSRKPFCYTATCWFKARSNCVLEPLLLCRECHPITVITPSGSGAVLIALSICFKSV